MEWQGSIRTPSVLRLATLALASLALAACQRDTTAPASAPHEETRVFTRADDLPPFELEPIGLEEQGDFDLVGDKSCHFATHPAARPLVLATGFFRRPQQAVQVLVKYGGQVQPGTSTTPGGFDAIRREATFDTGGMIIDVARIDVEPDGSRPAKPNRALLRMTMAGQEQEVIEGFWICTV